LLVLSRIIVIEGVLSFLGLSVPPPQPTWGNMIADGQADLATLPYIPFIPAALMFLTVLSINLIGERLRARTDFRGSALCQQRVPPCLRSAISCRTSMRLPA